MTATACATRAPAGSGQLKVGLTAAGVSQTAEHKAVLSGGATVDATGSVEIEAAVCVVAGTVIAGTTSGACLP